MNSTNNDINKKQYILAIDEGTTSTRVGLINKNFQLEAFEQLMLPQIYQKEGWNEHDPELIMNNIYKLIEKVLNDNTDVIFFILLIYYRKLI
jgi:glycerol kinase